MEESLEQSKDISTLNADLTVAQVTETPPAHKMKGSAANIEPNADEEIIDDEVDDDNYEDEGFE